MKTTFQFLGFDIHSAWYSMLDRHVDSWQRLTAVTATEVVMERQREGRRAYRVQVRLEVSGGALQTEAITRTLKAALLMASQDLETQIQARKARRVERRANNHHPVPARASGLLLKPIVPDGGKPASRSAPPPSPTQPHPKVNG